jgi:hypothetical protein
MSAVTNVAMVQKFEVIPKTFNVVGICTSRNAAQKWITKLYEE